MNEPSNDAIRRLKAALEGRYRVEREIGEGGMATVYLAEDLRHERKVALKVLKPELAAVVGAERFLTEIKTTANLQHPHILPLHDSGEADGFLFFVMPYVEGDTLRDKIDREKQLSVADALDIAKKVASALDYAHEHGVVHRDIKPGNILLSERGEPTVADFGIALAVAQAGGGRVTETGLSMGTPHYMSPEQATGDRDVDPRTDIYALGCVLYEMLTGDPPYGGSTAQAVLAQILTAEPLAPTTKRPSIPPNVDAAIRKALEKLPADRFASAQEFSKALADPGFRHGEEVGTGVAAGAGPWKAVSVVAVAAALGLAAVVAWLLLRPLPPKAIARWEVTLPEGLVPSNNNGVNVALSPDGSRLAFVATSSDGVDQLWLRPLDQLSPVAIAGTEGVRSPRFSPDGAEVAFIARGSLMVAPLSGAPPRTLVPDSVAEGQGGLAWSSDGWLYFKKAGSEIWRVPEEGGAEEEVTLVEDGDFEWPEALPGGKGLLLTEDLGDPIQDSIAVFSLETGESTALLQGAMARYSDSGHIVYASGDGILVAVPFDLNRLEVTGPSRPLVEGLQVNGGSAAQYTLSESGALAWRPGSAGSSYLPVWVGRDGSQTPLDSRLTGSFEAPAISPDGGRIAFEHTPVGGATDIWLYEIAQGTLDRFTFDGNSARPFWSPDGSQIGFLSDPLGDPGLYALASNGSETAPRVLRQGPGQNIQEGLWTPDQSGIVFRVGAIAAGIGDTDLYYAALDPDSAATPILDTPFTLFSPALSPDGRWLAYTSNESGQFEVYVRPFPGPGGRLPVSVGGGEDPVWAPRGGEILYTGPAGNLIVATVRTEPDFSVLSREPHPEWPSPLAPTTTQNFDISPIDQRILMLQGDNGQQAGAQVRDVVVENFFEELKQVVPE